jgi:hypothetical protein
MAWTSTLTASTSILMAWTSTLTASTSTAFIYPLKNKEKHFYFFKKLFKTPKATEIRYTGLISVF